MSTSANGRTASTINSRPGGWVETELVIGFIHQPGRSCRLDGTVEIIDQDEFEENRVSYGYPAELVEGAIAAADRAVALLRAGAEPFDGTAEGWIQSAFGLE